MVQGDKQPIYEETLEDVRRFNEDPQLPFNAFGTLALARQEFDANSGSSQVFFLLKVCLHGRIGALADLKQRKSLLRGLLSQVVSVASAMLCHAMLCNRARRSHALLQHCVLCCAT